MQNLLPNEGMGTSGKLGLTTSRKVQMLPKYSPFILFIFYPLNFFSSEINPRTAELLFEIYSRSKSGTDDKFLGLGIVGMEELLISPAQRQTISLQSRPYQDDKISGTLTVEVITTPIT